MVRRWRTHSAAAQLRFSQQPVASWEAGPWVLLSDPGRQARPWLLPVPVAGRDSAPGTLPARGYGSAEPLAAPVPGGSLRKSGHFIFHLLANHSAKSLFSACPGVGLHLPPTHPSLPFPLLRHTLCRDLPRITWDVLLPGPARVCSLKN